MDRRNFLRTIFATGVAAALPSIGNAGRTWAGPNAAHFQDFGSNVIAGGGVAASNRLEVTATHAEGYPLTMEIAEVPRSEFPAIDRLYQHWADVRAGKKSKNDSPYTDFAAFEADFVRVYWEHRTAAMDLFFKDYESFRDSWASGVAPTTTFRPREKSDAWYKRLRDRDPLVLLGE